MEPFLNTTDVGLNEPGRKWDEAVTSGTTSLVQRGSTIVPIAAKLQSPNYASGVGWRLDSSGNTEFTAPTINNGLSGTFMYYVADSSGGAVTRRLTFTDGILVSQT